MPDPRFFAKIDVGYFDNPKVVDLIDDRPRVVMLHLRAILYCRQHLTDGVFPVRQVARLVGASWCSRQCSEQCSGHCGEHCSRQCSEQCDMCEAVQVGLFEWYKLPGKAMVHDYLKHQDSAARVGERSSQARRAAEARHRGKPDARSSARGNADSSARSNARSNAEERRGEESKKRALTRERESRFGEFWDLYPKKVDKRAAERRWATVVKDVDPDAVIEGLRRQLPELRSTDPKYVKGPAVWLNAGAWENEPAVPARDAGRDVDPWDRVPTLRLAE